jgi:hypothetical protein
MYPSDSLLRDNLTQAHGLAWERIGAAGDFFAARDRVEMVRAAREALDCSLCAARKSALSPNAIAGAHEGNAQLNEPIVEVIHRLVTDPGRLTRAWCDGVLDCGVSRQAYVEVVSVVASSVIIDTLHRALGLECPALPAPQPGEPRGEYNTQAVDAGAWLPVLDAPAVMGSAGLPEVPNIVRALGLVPSAVELFFATFRPHYALQAIPLSISQTQAEFVAARVSAINECFY